MTGPTIYEVRGIYYDPNGNIIVGMKFPKLGKEFKKAFAAEQTRRLRMGAPLYSYVAVILDFYDLGKPP